ncbi:MAG: hypothetical protein ABSA39_16445 [Edaphobacter sp.]
MLRNRMRSTFADKVRNIMAKKFSELYNKIPAERRARIEEQVRKERRKIALSEMRKARSLTQNAIAEQLHIDQGAVYADETIDLELSSQ